MNKLLYSSVIIAVRFQYSYKGYESREKAIGALKRKCKGFNKKQYEDAFDKGCELFNFAGKIIEENNVVGFKKDTGKFDYSDQVEILKSKTSGFSDSAYEEAVSWAYYWIVCR